jgi:ABC-type sugar transport system ATPase subunit
MTFLRVSNLSKKFNKEVVLRRMTFDLPKGEVMAIVGESGSGKSTLLRIISGHDAQDRGEVFLRDIKFQNAREKLIPGNPDIQLVPQGFMLYPNSTVQENISRPLLRFERNYREQRLKTLLKLLNLTPHKDKLPRQLSGGQQQKVAIGRALSSEPKVLLLDEPFSNLDTIQRRELIGELKSLFFELGITVLFVTHDLDDALQMTNELMVMQKGRIMQKGTAQDVFRNPSNIYTAKLFSHLNPIPGNGKQFVRPLDISIVKSQGTTAEVLNSQYLTHFNLLTVRISHTEIIWKIEDYKRDLKKGDSLFLHYEEGNILNFQ